MRRSIPVRSLLVVGIALLLAGCFDLDVQTSVSGDAKFTGTMTTTLKVEALGNLEGSTQDDLTQGLPQQPVTTGPVTVKYESAQGEIRQVVDFTDATRKQIEEGLQAADDVSDTADGSVSLGAATMPLIAKADGDRMVVRLDSNAANELQGQGAAPSESELNFFEVVFKDSTMAIDLQMPGAIEQTSGLINDLSGQDGVSVEVDGANLKLAVPLLTLIKQEISASDTDDYLTVRSTIDGRAASTDSDEQDGGAPDPTDEAASGESTSGPAAADSSDGGSSVPWLPIIGGIALGAAAVATIIVLSRQAR